MARELAMWIDREHWVRNQSWMAVNALCKQIAALGTRGAPARSTVKAWRAEDDYVAFVEA